MTRPRSLAPAPRPTAALLAATLCLLAPAAARDSSSIRFEDGARDSGIAFVFDNARTPVRYTPETMIGGVALLDYDGDGRLDLYLVNGATLPGMDKSSPRFWNRLYRNAGGGRFEDATERAGVRGAGYGMGVAAADYDNDGDPDLYVAGVDRNQLFRNEGDGRFTDVTAQAGVEGVHPRLGKTFAIGAGFFDYDNDGRLDLLVVGYLRWSAATAPECKVQGLPAYCSPNVFEGQPNLLYRNRGDGTFEDVSERSGIGAHVGKGMGHAFADYDADGFTDVFVSNDTFRNFLFRNRGDGTFEEVALLAGTAFNESGRPVAGMGADFRDVDDDGWPDLFQTAMIYDTFPLFRNLRGRVFEDVTVASGVARASSGWTAWGNGIVDLDNDGWKDLFAARAAILDNSAEIDRVPYEQPCWVLRNLGGARFEDVSASAGAALAEPAAHRGAAFGDLDGDGRVDVVVNRIGRGPAVLMNRSAPANHWLQVRLEGTRSNRDGLGARLVLRAGTAVRHNHATTSVGYNSASDRRVHFGLGAETKASLEVLWPSGARQLLPDVAADQVLVVREPAADGTP